MNNHLKRVLLVITAIMNVLILQAENTHAIDIDHSKRELIAPEGESFQWYFKGEKIEGAVSNTFSPEKSGEYRVDVTDNKGNITRSKIIVSVTSGGIRKVHLIGDSTVSNYNASQYPFMGWGQVLQWFFNDSLVQVENHARGGRSSRSYYEEGLWTPVKNSLDTGDYVFIQFGHNDRDWSKPDRYTHPDSMKIYLKIYINDTRSEGAFPVLVSPMSMNTGTRNVFTEAGSDYRGAMLDIANEMNVPFIDLNMKSYAFYQQIGVEYAKYFVHMGLESGEYSNYPNGYSDFWTHYQEMGALVMAKFVTDGIREQDTLPELAILDSALKPLYSVSVSLGKPNAGMYTFSSDYPEGATVTLKARLNLESDLVQFWADTINHDTLPGNLVTFTMEPHNYAFVGTVTDCHGTNNGTASIDACGICSGGATELLPCTESIPCIDICETNAEVELMLDNDVLYRLVLSTDSVNQAYFNQDVDVSVADSFVFQLVYFNPSQEDSLNIYVDNNLELSGVPLAITSDWEVGEFTLYLQPGTHTIRVQNTSETGGTKYDYLSLFSKDISGNSCIKDHTQGTAFGQTDSLIVIEAENYSRLFSASNGTKWRKVLFPDASSKRAIVAPDGPSYATASTAQYNAPIAKYQVNFPHAGDYSVWARIYAFDATKDSYHMGLNGDVLLEKVDLFNSTNVYEEFTWMHVADKKLAVSTAGVHDLDVFCREPHFIIDKIILSLDDSYSPSGYGPAETGIDPITSIKDFQIHGDSDLSMEVYPNPADSELHIAYHIPKSGLINISIYNATGQKIHQLVNEYQLKGSQEMTWKFGGNADIASGLYMIRIEAPYTSQIQKIFIQK